MATDYLPIDPERVAELGVDPVQLDGLRPRLFEPGGIEVNSTQLSATAAAELGFGSLVSLKASGEAFYFSVDFAAAQTVSAPDPDVLGGFTASVWGAGLRLAVKSWSVKGEVSASIYGAAASAELGFSKTAFALKSFGTGVAGLKEVTDLAQKALGKFDVTSVASLGSAVSVIGKYLEENVSVIKPEPLGVVRTVRPGASERTASAVYAIECVANRTSFANAERQLLGDDAPDKGFRISVPEVRAVYLDVFGIADPNEEPTSMLSERAWRLLRG